MSGSGVTPPQGLEVVGIEGIACGTIPRGRVSQVSRGCRRDEKAPFYGGLVAKLVSLPECGGLWLGGVGLLVVEDVISDGGPVVDDPLGAGEFYGRDDAQFLEVVECG